MATKKLDKSAADASQSNAATLTKVNVSIPSYPKWSLEVPREPWEFEYDKIENELLKPILPGSAALTIRKPYVEMNANPLNDPVEKSITRPHSSKLPASIKTAPKSDVKAVTTPHSSMKKVVAPMQNTTNTTTTAVQPMSSPTSRSNKSRPGTADVRSMMSSITNLSSPKKVDKPSIPDLSALYSVLCPTVDFKGAVSIDSTNMDLSWMREPKRLEAANGSSITLENIRDDIFVNPTLKEREKHVIALSSPRSILICLRNGVSIKDLQRRPLSYFGGVGVDHTIAELRHDHYESRRVNLLNELRAAYREVRNEIGWNEIYNFLKSYDPMNPSTTNSPRDASMIQEKKEKQISILENNRKRLMKQIEYREGLRHAMEIAEQKRKQAAQEQAEAQEKKLKESAQRKAEADERMRKLKEQTQEYNQQYIAKLEQKAKELAHRDELRRQAEAEKMRERKEHHDQAKMEYERKMQDTSHRMQEIMEEKRRAFEEKERLAQERKQVMENQKAEEQKEKVARKSKVESLRAAALEAAKNKLESVRQHALEQQRLVEDRLAHFSVERQTQSEIRHKEELEKREHIKAVIQTSKDRMEHKKNETLSKQAAMEEALKASRQRQQEMSKIELEKERLIAEEKQLFLQRQKRANEFKKALVIDSMRRKEHQVQATNEMKAQIWKQTMESRIEVQREKDRITSSLLM